MPPERRLAAILAADVVGSSRLMEAHEAYALAAIKSALNDVLVASALRHRGRFIKTMGDGALIEFASAVEAVACARAVQEVLGMKAAQDPPERRILMRIGINLGDVVIGDDGDIHGDGVNVAARLEPLATAGGIVVSGAVHEHLIGKLDIAFEDRGEVTLKNIGRPVRVYASGGSPASSSQAALPLPDKPSIAILPFTNMSGDPEQEYFADGLVEEITTALSRVRQFFVIARNSSFTYKGRAVDVKRVGRELGVRYVLEGSVRKSGNRVRITGQLIEAESGHHVWADRFDGDLADLFDLQDKVTENVVAVIERGVSAAEIARATAKPTESLDAYDLYLRALQHLYSPSKEGLDDADKLLSRAIEVDPNYSLAKATLAFTYVVRGANGLGGDVERAEGTRLAKEAIAANRDDPLTLRSAGHALAYLGREFEMAEVALERAVALNPNSAAIQSSAGWVNIYRGKLEAAVENFNRAIRLSPLDPEMGYILSGLAATFYFQSRYDKSLDYSARSVREMPKWVQGHFFKTGSLVGLGRLDEAHEALNEILKAVPTLDAKSFEALMAQPNPEYRRKFIAHLIAAGLPG